MECLNDRLVENLETGKDNTQTASLLLKATRKNPKQVLDSLSCIVLHTMPYSSSSTTAGRA